MLMSAESRDAAVWTLLCDGLDVMLDGDGPGPPRKGPLTRLLARARHSRLPVTGRSTLVAWALTGDVDAVRRWPPGPVLYVSGSRRLSPPGIMCADPVSLAPCGDDLTIRGPRTVALTPAESKSLAATLAQGLAGSGASFVENGGQWFLEFQESPATQWWDPDDIDGRRVMPCMPAGPTAALVRRVMTEAQMILHEHPVNLARIASGQLPANGLWPWGWSASPLTEPSLTPQVLGGEDRYARALSDLAGRAVAVADPLRPGGSALVVLQIPAQGETLMSTLRECETTWWEPLLDGLRRGRIDRIRLVTPGGHCFEVRRLDMLRFWRRWRR